MMDNHSPNTDGQQKTLEQLIRERAYQLWEMEGRPEGRQDEYWRRAAELVAAEAQSSYPPSQSRRERT